MLQFLINKSQLGADTPYLAQLFINLLTYHVFVCVRTKYYYEHELMVVSHEWKWPMMGLLYWSVLVWIIMQLKYLLVSILLNLLEMLYCLCQYPHSQHNILVTKQLECFWSSGLKINVTIYSWLIVVCLCMCAMSMSVCVCVCGRYFLRQRGPEHTCSFCNSIDWSCH